ncbi:helix-turn-helix domain-containing protein [Nocardioides sp. NPDC006273]|uniref:TetR/AcrR family transcriptional regulator n=1 Tax=Nocardioides sp. NPDC006273 TaxID=3155598 RepID=UPI0033AB48DF
MTRTPTATTGQRAARPASRREDIAAAAIELFLDRGIAATRVEDILAAAGVSVGSFYHHFRDKLDLAATVYLEHLQRFQSDLLVELDRHERTEDAVRGLVTAYLRWAGADPRAMGYLHQCRESNVAEISEGEEARLKQAFYGRLTGWLGERAATGELRALPNEHSLALWLGPAEQLVRAAIDPSEHFAAPEPDALVAHLTRAERVLADAAWETLRRPTTDDDADQARE